MQVTLVAHYGPKPAELAEHVGVALTAIERSSVGRHFRPYAPDQMHGTIVALDRAPARAGFDNANRLAAAGVRQPMNFARALTLARAFPRLTFRFGGFALDDRRIESAGQTAYERSFQMRPEQGKVIIIGWHHDGENFAAYRALWAVRRRFAAQCGIWPKYDNDSDFYMTLGDLIDLPAPGSADRRRLAGAMRALEAAVRQEFARHPVDVPTAASDLSFVRYSSPALPPTTSRAHPAADPALTPMRLRQWYNDRP